MKKLYNTIAFMFITLFINAQARTTIAEYQKTMQPAIETSYPYSEKTVMNAIEDKMGKMGYKGKESKGYTIYRGVKMSEIGPDFYDLYFKADRKSRKEKEVSVVTMLISSGSDKFIGDSTSTSAVDNAKKYLNNLSGTINAFDLELQINEQDEALKKATNKMAGLVEDGENLVKKKEKLEKDIEDNIKKQGEQKTEVEKQKQIFETLRSKRKQ